MMMIIIFENKEKVQLQVNKKTSYILKEFYCEATAIIQNLLTITRNYILMNIKSLK